MSATVTSPLLYAANRALRKFAADNHLPKDTILRGCKAAKQAIAEHRSFGVVILEGQKAMRSATPHHAGAVA